MIRRFETYAFLPDVETERREELATVLAEAGRYIPEVLHCAVGWNRSEAPAELVWEHAFASAETYRRYMVHPYHVEMIDRYVLADSPERIVEPAKGAALFGYHVPDISPVAARSGRRVILLSVDPEADHQAVVDVFCSLQVQSTSAVAWAGGPNELATTWFDGESPLPVSPPRWSHIWEAGYSSLPEDPGPALDHPHVRALRDLRYELVDSRPRPSPDP